MKNGEIVAPKLSLDLLKFWLSIRKTYVSLESDGALQVLAVGMFRVFQTTCICFFANPLVDKNREGVWAQLKISKVNSTEHAKCFAILEPQ